MFNLKVDLQLHCLSSRPTFVRWCIFFR